MRVHGCVVRVVACALVLCGGCADRETEIARIEDSRQAGSTELIERLAEGSVESRVRAAVAMGRIQSPTYVEALVEAADADPAEIRAAALFALGQLGLAEGAAPRAAAVEACRRALDDPDPLIAMRAVEALGKLAAPDTLGTVTATLEHPNPEVRAAAAMALFRYRFVPVWRRLADEAPALPPAAVEALIAATEDETPEVRRAAVYACSRYAQPESAAAAERLLSDLDEWTRLFAVRALGRTGNATHVPAVATALLDRSPRVRTEAVLALPRLDAPGSALRLIDDRDLHVRAAVAAALGADGSEATFEPLLTLETDPAPSVRGAAIVALASRLGLRYADSLGVWLRDPSWVIPRRGRRSDHRARPGGPRSDRGRPGR